MDVMLLRVFQHQVLLQCKFIITAAKELDTGIQHHSELFFRAFEKPNTDALRESQEAIFYALQNLLNAAADVSKALWGKAGSKPADRQRYEARQQLRDSIGIKDTSPLRTVTVRNKFEHYDENLDKWWKQPRNHFMADLNIGSKDRSIVGIDEIDKFRHYDSATNIAIFWGVEFNIQDILVKLRLLFLYLPVKLKSRLGKD